MFGEPRALVPEVVRERREALASFVQPPLVRHLGVQFAREFRLFNFNILEAALDARQLLVGPLRFSDDPRELLVGRLEGRECLRVLRGFLRQVFSQRIAFAGEPDDFTVEFYNSLGALSERGLSLTLRPLGAAQLCTRSLQVHECVVVSSGEGIPRAAKRRGGFSLRGERSLTGRLGAFGRFCIRFTSSDGGVLGLGACARCQK